MTPGPTKNVGRGEIMPVSMPLNPFGEDHEAIEPLTRI
jgi:hypothetical protein